MVQSGSDLENTAASRVATYVDPVSRTREEATYISVGDAELFCVVHRSLSRPRGASSSALRSW